jgi:hypothetical protein
VCLLEHKTDPSPHISFGQSIQCLCPLICPLVASEPFTTVSFPHIGHCFLVQRYASTQTYIIPWFNVDAGLTSPPSLVPRTVAPAPFWRLNLDCVWLEDVPRSVCIAHIEFARQRICECPPRRWFHIFDNFSSIHNNFLAPPKHRARCRTR